MEKGVFTTFVRFWMLSRTLKVAAANARFSREYGRTLWQQPFSTIQSHEQQKILNNRESRGINNGVFKRIPTKLDRRAGSEEAYEMPKKANAVGYSSQKEGTSVYNSRSCYREESGGFQKDSNRSAAWEQVVPQQRKLVSHQFGAFDFIILGSGGSVPTRARGLSSSVLVLGMLTILLLLHRHCNDVIVH